MCGPYICFPQIPGPYYRYTSSHELCLDEQQSFPNYFEHDSKGAAIRAILNI